MTKYATLEQAHGALTLKLGEATRELDVLRGRLANREPGAAHYQLQWTNDYHMIAAREYVLASVLAWVDHALSDPGRATRTELGLVTDEATLGSFRADILRMAMNHGTRLQQSTSPTSNLSADCERVVWCELAGGHFTAF